MLSLVPSPVDCPFRTALPVTAEHNWCPECRREFERWVGIEKAKMRILWNEDWYPTGTAGERLRELWVRIRDGAARRRDGRRRVWRRICAKAGE